VRKNEFEFFFLVQSGNLKFTFKLLNKLAMPLSPEDAFNKRIKMILKEQSGSSKVIEKISRAFPDQKSYYSLFDDIGYKLGIGIVAQSVYKGESDRLLGYIPHLKYYPENPLGERPRDFALNGDTDRPLKLNEAYSLMAKELIYRIAGIPNLDELLQKLKGGLNG
jgi:hypothetical protein